MPAGTCRTAVVKCVLEEHDNDNTSRYSGNKKSIYN